MNLETIALTLVLVAVTLPLLVTVVRGRSRAVRAGGFAAWAVASAAIPWAATGIEAPEPLTGQPVEVKRAGYVSSRACKSCHPDQYATWHRSYHRTMTQFASTDVVAGPLAGGVAVDARGQTFRLEARGDEVWVEMDDPTWDRESAGTPPRIWRKVVQTTGSHEEQFYWTSMGEGRKLSLLPVMFRLLDEQRWAPLDGCCISDPTSVQESETGRWNRVCNRCHATHAWPGLDEPEDSLGWDTVAAELGIACEACHGPGAEHVAVNRDPRRRYALHASGDPDDSIVNPGRLDQQRASDACAQCHGVTAFKDNEAYAAWKRDGYRYRPGDVLQDLRRLHTEGDDKFWPDGMIRVSGREYNGLARSPCFIDGDMSCLSCHVMHKTADDPRSLDEWANDQLKLGMEGNAACTQCHGSYLDDAVVTAHTHHGASSSGSDCMNCHMPYTTYGLLKGIRSHQISNPSVQESVEHGRPNACNLCHMDKTLEWTAESLAEWYGVPAPELSRDERTIAASVLWTLKGDSGLRALMASGFGWDTARRVSGTDWMPPFLIALLRDPYHAVRYIAHRSFRKHAESRVLDYDFMDASDELLERTTPAYLEWVRNGAGRRLAARSKLITETGELDLAQFERLFAQRDLRRVTLNE